MGRDEGLLRWALGLKRREVIMRGAIMAVLLTIATGVIDASMDGRGVDHKSGRPSQNGVLRLEDTGAANTK